MEPCGVHLVMLFIFDFRDLRFPSLFPHTAVGLLKMNGAIYNYILLHRSNIAFVIIDRDLRCQKFSEKSSKTSTVPLSESEAAGMS